MTNEIEPINTQPDTEPIYSEEDQVLIDEANSYIEEATQPFYTLAIITSHISFYSLLMYGKEFLRNPIYIRLTFAIYISFSLFELITNFVTCRYIVFLSIIYFLYKLLKQNNLKDSKIIYIFTYVAFAILFNPFIQFHFIRDTWLFIDLFILVITALEPFLIKPSLQNIEDTYDIH
jgi:hypothetical protein